MLTYILQFLWDTFGFCIIHCPGVWLLQCHRIPKGHFPDSVPSQWAQSSHVSPPFHAQFYETTVYPWDSQSQVTNSESGCQSSNWGDPSVFLILLSGYLGCLNSHLTSNFRVPVNRCFGPVSVFSVGRWAQICLDNIFNAILEEFNGDKSDL